MKKFFTKIKDWFKRHKPSKRKLIQVYAALLYNANIKGFISGNIYQGATKFMCVPGLNCYSCPGAVGACPLGALQNALAASGTRAPAYVFGIIILLGLILGRTVCGFLCPVGLGQELLYKIKTPKLKKSKFTYILSYLKYVILVVLAVAIPLMFGKSGATVPGFCKYICPAGTFGGALALIVNPNNDSMLMRLGSLFTWKFAVLVVFMVASVFIFRFFCRFFCPLGAIYGFFSKIALLGVKLDKNKCTDCGLCVNACKMDIKHVGDHECIQCGECISVCPTKAISWKGQKLFVHENAVGVPSEEKPLAAVLKQEPSVSGATAELVVAAVQPSADSVASARAKQQKRNFWLQLSAWIAALALLAGVLVYYNFIDVPVKAAEGEICPEFTLSVYGTNEKFSISETRGSVTFVCFWRPGEGDEILAELSETEDQLHSVYGYNSKSVVISDAPADVVCGLIEQSGWKYTFVEDNGFVWKNLTQSIISNEEEKQEYSSLMVLDVEGRIRYNQWTSKTEGSLYEVSTRALSGNKEGDICPEFTIKLYGEEDGEYKLTENTYSPADSRGKITVINFWATWCGGCVAELPYFEQLQLKYPDRISVIAIQGNEDRPVPKFIQDKNWADYTLTFAQDNKDKNKCLTYELLDGGNAWPFTLIVNEQGIIVKRLPRGFDSLEKLEEVIAPYLN